MRIELQAQFIISGQILIKSIYIYIYIMLDKINECVNKNFPVFISYAICGLVFCYSEHVSIILSIVLL